MNRWAKMRQVHVRLVKAWQNKEITFIQYKRLMHRATMRLNCPELGYTKVF